MRLLLGGAPKKWFYLVLNPYVETNIENTDITEAALDPILFEHRDMMYAEHLELPLSL